MYNPPRLKHLIRPEHPSPKQWAQQLAHMYLYRQFIWITMISFCCYARRICRKDVRSHIPRRQSTLTIAIFQRSSWRASELWIFTPAQVFGKMYKLPIRYLEEDVLESGVLYQVYIPDHLSYILCGRWMEDAAVCEIMDFRVRFQQKSPLYTRITQHYVRIRILCLTLQVCGSQHHEYKRVDLPW